MDDVWKGDISLPDGNTVKDVGFTSPHGASIVTLPNVALRLLSTVETSKIPIYLAAGPSYDVWTTCQATEEWFESILLSKHASQKSATSNGTGQGWWDLARSQSPIGILVQVDNENRDSRKPRVTEILFYGTIAATSSVALPTPPSSSPEHEDSHAEQLPELRVHALPLSSDLLYQQATVDLAPASPALSTTDPVPDVEGQFLPNSLGNASAPGSPKRKRDIFEAATIASKKAKSKGGISIAAAAARGSESQSQAGHRKSLSIDTKASPYPDIRPPSANGSASRPASRQLSRSPSICSDVRPLSRKGLSESQNKRSNLFRVSTISVQPEEPTTESRNKEALSKVVMAAMRMHGLQQRKKTRTRRQSVVVGLEDTQQTGEEATAEVVANDEEYKLVYHQTFKGAAFALRKHILEKPLHAQPDLMRDVVERLLSIYLSDPLAQPLQPEAPANLLATPGSKQRLGIPGSSHSHASPFDLPSGSRPGMLRSKTESQINTGSPVSRRHVNNGDAAPT